MESMLWNLVPLWMVGILVHLNSRNFVAITVEMYQHIPIGTSTIFEPSPKNIFPTKNKNSPIFHFILSASWRWYWTRRGTFLSETRSLFVFNSASNGCTATKSVSFTKVEASRSRYAQAPHQRGIIFFVDAVPTNSSVVASSPPRRTRARSLSSSVRRRMTVAAEEDTKEVRRRHQLCAKTCAQMVGKTIDDC